MTAPAEHGPYPLGLRLAGRAVLVVGGGEVALRRVTGLLDAGADVTVVAPEVTPLIEHLADRGALRLLRRDYLPGDVTTTAPWLAQACTDQPAVNAAVVAEAERARIWCVRADDASAATAWVPAVGREGGLTVAVHAGRDPGRAAAARDRALAALRDDPPPAVRPSRRRGTVALVGAGPGDPGLMTERAKTLLAEADVVVTDRLVPLVALSTLRPEVLVVDAAKLPGGRAMPQEEINATLVEHALAGRFVVRLKGGDPFVFGRGMEEAQACAAAGVLVEVVPGITSAIAVPALAGIAVTTRGASQAFVVVSGHVPPGDPRSTVDWAALAGSGATLVVLMGMSNLPHIAATLLAAGTDPATPVAVVAEGTTERQRVVLAGLADVAEQVRAAGVGSPAVIVIGEVARTASAAEPAGAGTMNAW